MTYEEAIRRITVHNSIHQRREPRSVYITEALHMAVVALEKQIPKRPIEDRAKVTDFQTFSCPICHKKIVSRLDGNWIAGRPQKYCDDCGQKLLWESDTE